jgi:nucleotide-binding universal stress UspA family protein
MDWTVTESTTKRKPTSATSEHVPGRFHSLLIPIDLTPSSDRVLGRVALLPLADDVQLTLLHVVPGSLPPGGQRQAERDARKALSEEVWHLRKPLPRKANIASLVKVGTAAKEIATCATKLKVDLIVMGRGGGRVLQEAFLGSTAERVVRRAQRPVLVVRLRPRRAYRSPALALELDQAAAQAADRDGVRGGHSSRRRAVLENACPAWLTARGRRESD